MPASISITDLTNAKTDVDHIAEISTSSALTATDRLGNVKHTVKGAVNTLAAFNARGAWLTATAYALKDVYTDSGIAYVTVVSHTSTSIATDLAAGKVTIHQGATREDLADPSGAELIGANAYQTQDDVNLEQASVKKYGASPAASAAANSVAFNLAAASGKKKVIVPQGTYALNPANPVTPAAGQAWDMEGATFTFTGATGTLFSCVAVNDWALNGNFAIQGDGATVGSAIGIYISDCARWSVDSPTISNVRGTGIYMDPGASTTARGTHGTITNPVIYNCYYGYTDEAGTGAEFCTIKNPRIYGCTVHGLKTCAGNTSVIGGHIVDNAAKGVHLAAGNNHGHGIFSGTNISHNAVYGIHAEQVLNGFTFNGCHIYENDIWFDRSEGIHILGGIYDPAAIYNYKDGSSGINVIDGCFNPGGYGPKRAVGGNDGHDQLIIRNTWGAGSFAASGGKDTAGVVFNDPSLCYVQAQRDTGAFQSLTSGVSAQLTFSSFNYFNDRRGVGNAGAGTYTIPAGLSGQYHIDVDLLFTGTAMSVTASYLEVKIDGVTKKLATASIYSTTLVQTKTTFDIYINAGSVVTFVATITGTTPTFGNANWPSNISINKIA